MTKREIFAEVLEIIKVVDGEVFDTDKPREDLIAGLEHEIELLDNRKTTPRKPTARQEENETFKAAILAALADSEPVTIGGLIDLCPALKGLSNQRITHMMTALRGEGQVKREYRKKVAYFSLGAEDTDEPTKEENDRQMELDTISRMIAAYDAGFEG